MFVIGVGRSSRADAFYLTNTHLYFRLRAVGRVRNAALIFLLKLEPYGLIEPVVLFGGGGDKWNVDNLDKSVDAQFRTSDSGKKRERWETIDAKMPEFFCQVNIAAKRKLLARTRRLARN